MKSKQKSVFCVLLVLTLLVPFSLRPLASAPDFTGEPLRFNEDGSFRILQITDTQDTQWPSPNLLTMTQKALDESKPDLVVFTGDQLKNYDSDFDGPNVEWKVRQALRLIVEPIVRRGLPFAFAFGNHDSCLSVTLEEQVAYLQTFPGCLVVDEGSSVTGCGNYNLPVISSDGARTAFNLYFLDSGQDMVQPDQVDWYVSKSDELREANGGVPVPSFEFQHIIAYNDNLINAFAQQGDVIASFCGHDHYRTDTVENNGVNFVHTPTAGFNAFGPGKEVGVRVIDVFEDDPENYETSILTFIDLLGDNPITDLRFTLFTLGEMEGTPIEIVAGLIPKIALCLSYAFQQAEGSPPAFAFMVLEFFGVDVRYIW